MIRADWAAWATVAVSRYSSHPDFDDLLQEARIAAWRSLLRYPEADTGRRRALAMGAARKAAISFFRSPGNRINRVTQRGYRAPETVEWSELTEGEEPGRRDFAPYLIACL